MASPVTSVDAAAVGSAAVGRLGAVVEPVELQLETVKAMIANTINLG